MQDNESHRNRYHYSERNHGHHESGEKTLLKWILGIVSTLLVAAIIGAWQQSIQLAELRADVRNLQYQVNEIKSRVGPNYRGGGRADVD